jgi:hypothetical protein
MLTAETQAVTLSRSKTTETWDPRVLAANRKGNHDRPRGKAVDAGDFACVSRSPRRTNEKVETARSNEYQK